MSNLSPAKKRFNIYRRWRNIRALLLTARREHDRLVRMARDEGFRLETKPFYPPPTQLELNIYKKLINKRILSELLAGNQLSVTNRYTPEKYEYQEESLKSIIFWWATDQNEKGNLKTELFE